MNTRQSNLLLLLKEVQKFLDEHGDRLGGVSQSGTRKKLDEAVAALTESAAVQSGSGLAAKSSTQRQRLFTRELVNDHMWPIARVAAIELAPLPEITPLAMPKGRETRERLVALARGMAIEAAKYKETFIEAGLPLDFIEQLNAAADAVSGSISTRKQKHAERGGATKVLENQMQHARQLLKALDAFVRKAGKGQTGLLRAWEIVKRQRQVGGPAKLPTPAGNPPFDSIGGAA